MPTRTQPNLGVSESDQALLYVILSPVGPYYKTGLPLKLLAGERAGPRADAPTAVPLTGSCLLRRPEVRARMARRRGQHQGRRDTRRPC